ncbi:hypothetical protein [Halobaculum sp. P14]|uniref:hypothetical protein n=1 Tax=Halobaculum sp. P14 TaxID=3421638 RepID=UPI003EBC3DDC
MTLLSNPELWVKTILRKWVVGGILDAATYVLGWLVFGYEKSTNIILDAVPILRTPYQLVESAITGAIVTVFGAVRSVVELTGLAGPPAVAVTVVLLVSIVLALGWGLFSVIPGSDAIEDGVGVFTK